MECCKLLWDSVFGKMEHFMSRKILRFFCWHIFSLSDLRPMLMQAQVRVSCNIYPIGWVIVRSLTFMLGGNCRVITALLRSGKWRQTYVSIIFPSNLSPYRVNVLPSTVQFVMCCRLLASSCTVFTLHDRGENTPRLKGLVRTDDGRHFFCIVRQM